MKFDKNMAARAAKGKKALDARGGLWWLSPGKSAKDPSGKELADNVVRVCTALETAQIPRRWRNYVYYRYFTGEPYCAQFAYGMAVRPMGFNDYYGRFQFEPSTYNMVGTAADVYTTRVFSHKAFAEMVPENGDDTQRSTAGDIEGWLDGCWEESGYWRERSEVGRQAECYGSGYMLSDLMLDKKIGYECVDTNEMLFPNYDDPRPTWCMRRVWITRETAIDAFGTTPEAIDAIMDAQSAFPAFWFGKDNLDCEDVIPLVYAWRVNHVNGKKGRAVKVIAGMTLEDLPLDSEKLPVVRLDLYQKPSSCIGQGIPQLILGCQQKIDDLLDTMGESDARSAPKWVIEDASGINPDELGDSVAAVITKTAGSADPKYLVPENSIGSYAENRVRLYMELGMKRVHISEYAIQGEVPKQLTSAVALDKFQQIDDMTFLNIIGRLEDFDKENAEHAIALGKKYKPSYTTPGSERRLIKWEDVAMNSDVIRGIKIFNTGRFGQSIPAKQQQLAAMLAEGSITLDKYNKYLERPDMGGLMEQLNAPMTGADWQIDRLLKTGAYLPPSPFLSLEYAKQAIEARHIIAEKRGVNRQKLNVLLMWRSAVMELMEQKKTPDRTLNADGTSEGTPAIPDFGGTANANTPVAPSENPITPGMQPTTN